VSARTPRQFLYLGAAIGFALFVTGIAVNVVTQTTAGTITAVALEALGSSILFPILISFSYDRLREQWLGDEVWRLFNELSDAGISRVYKDRELSAHGDNAQVRLSTEFRHNKSGEVLMMGVTLRVFFNSLGPFYRDIESMLRDAGGAVKIRALVSSVDSPETNFRADIEEPIRSSEFVPQIVRDIESSLATARSLSTAVGPYLTFRAFQPAPYCTAVIFPHVCFFSPNLLAPETPVRLPMVLFREGSHGYRMVRSSFDFLWQHPQTVEAVRPASPT
jgi:hypothetical protein